MDLTVPKPVPFVTIVSSFVLITNGLNVAVTVLTSLMVTIQIEPLPAQAPPQRPKLDPGFGEAESLTRVLLTKELEHLLMTPGVPQ